MKITESQLKQLVRESIYELLNEEGQQIIDFNPNVNKNKNEHPSQNQNQEPTIMDLRSQKNDMDFYSPDQYEDEDMVDDEFYMRVRNLFETNPEEALQKLTSIKPDSIEVTPVKRGDPSKSMSLLEYNLAQDGFGPLIHQQQRGSDTFSLVGVSEECPDVAVLILYCTSLNVIFMIVYALPQNFA